MASKTDSTEPDYLHCFICLEHLRGRYPRLLSCHHSFCEACLKRLVKRGEIKCPKCRVVTDVKNEDVTSLTMNFHILPFLEESRKPEVESICQICRDSVAVFKCEQCNDTMCQFCSESHNQLKKFKKHFVVPLCLKHYEAVSQICTKCMEPACNKCLILDHRKHEDKVVPTEEGMEHIHEIIQDMVKTVSKDIDEIRNIIEEDEPKVIKAKDFINKYASQSKTSALEDKRQFEEMQIYYKKSNEIRMEQKAALRVSETIFNDLSKLQEENDDNCLAGFVGMVKMKASCENPENLKRVPPISSKFRISEQDDNILAEPGLVSEVTSNRELEMIHVVTGTTIWDDSIIFVDFEGKHVTHINSKGKVLFVYPLKKEDGPPVSVSIHGRSLYIAQSGAITEILNVNKPNESKRRYKPNIESIGEMCVISHTKII